MKRWIQRIVPILLLIAGPAAAGAAELVSMGTAYSVDIFKDANLSDVAAATKVWVNTFGIKNNIVRAGETLFLEDTAAWCAAAENQSFLLGVMQATDFIKLEPLGLVDPIFVFNTPAGVGEELLLIVHQNDAIESLQDLAGSELYFTMDPYAEIGRMWLDSLLAAEGLPHRSEHFRSITEKSKVSGALLPVFFKKKGATVVTQGSFNLMKELNPQVGKQLRVLARSPNFISIVVCLRRDCEPAFKAKISSAIKAMSDDPLGEQLLVTYRMSHFLNFKNDYLETLRVLVGRDNESDSIMQARPDGDSPDELNKKVQP